MTVIPVLFCFAEDKLHLMWQGALWKTVTHLQENVYLGCLVLGGHWDCASDTAMHKAVMGSVSRSVLTVHSIKGISLNLGRELGIVICLRYDPQLCWFPVTNKRNKKTTRQHMTWAGRSYCSRVTLQGSKYTGLSNYIEMSSSIEFDLLKKGRLIVYYPGLSYEIMYVYSALTREYVVWQNWVTLTFWTFSWHYSEQCEMNANRTLSQIPLCSGLEMLLQC